MKSQAKTVAAYLDALPDDRRAALKTLRALIKKTVPKASEGMEYGMPTYTQGEVLCAFASQKNYMALYLCAGNVVNAHRKELGKLRNESGIARVEVDARDRDFFYAHRNGVGFEKPASDSRPAIAGWLRI
jgi:uncharacterized protein YdhG (YjbR/CyaY superfamily)